MNTANLLTLSRLLATPFVVWLMYGETPTQRYGALALFIGAMLTDVFDGPLARRSGGTPLGTYLDPVADKTMILCVFVALGHLGALPMWMALVTIGRELIVSGVRDAAAAVGKVVGANWMGKTKTFLQTLTICLALFLMARLTPSGAPAWTALYVLAFVTVALSVLFALIFLHWNRRLLLGRERGL